MKPVRAVLFDFGHTLVDFHRTQEALHAAYEQIRARVEAAAYMEVPELLDLVERVAGGVDGLIADSYQEGRLEEVDQAGLLRDSFAGIGFDLPDDVLEHIVALDHSAYSNSISVDEEMLEVLQGLRAGGYAIGIVSNITLRPNLLREDFERWGLSRLVDAAVFSSEVGVRKPDGRIFREALTGLSAAPEEAVFVGDRLHDDVGGAQAAGMRAVQSRQFRQEADPDFTPDGVIEHLRELPGVLLRWSPPPAGEPGPA